MKMMRRLWLGLLASVVAVTVASAPAAAQQLFGLEYGQDAVANELTG